MSDCVIIGIGNPIKRDDGIGVRAVRYLEGKVPASVELVEGSVYCADLFTYLEGRSKAIFIDAIDAGDEPGAVYRFTPEQVRESKGGISLSVHDFGLFELIATAKLMDQCPDEIIIISVQVKNIEMGEELSEEVSAAIPRVHELVLGELGVGADEAP